MGFSYSVIAAHKRCKRYRLGRGKGGIPTGAMLDGCDRFPVRTFVFLNDAVTHKLLASDGVLTAREAGKVLLVHASGKAELVGQIAMPLAQGSVVLLPVILLGGRELFGVIRLDLRCRQRFRDSQHGQSPRENPVSIGSSSSSEATASVVLADLGGLLARVIGSNVRASSSSGRGTNAGWVAGIFQ